MNTTRHARSRRTTESGYSMAEILVATAIFAVIIVAALAIYDRSNRVFKQSVESADVQQNTRVAFNRLTADLRMAGFDFDRDGVPTGATVDTRLPDREYSIGTVVSDSTGGGLYRASTAGTTSSSATISFNATVGASTVDGGVTWIRIPGANQYQQPDEQIEFAGRTAITIRGNLDYESASAQDNGRETAYEPTGGQFPVVTTANDEIVTYALVSNNSSANNDSITFYADIAVPRTSYPGGSAESLVTINGIDTDLDTNGLPANPPYTLQRITLNADGTLNRVPVADNIRSVRFVYYEDQAGQRTLRDLSGAVIPTTGAAANTGTIGGLGQYDPANPAPVVQREIRKKIRAIRVELVGMSPYPDRDYTNPDEPTNALVKNYRTYTLATTIVPRNLGKHGMREQSVKPPGQPTGVRACQGGCGVVYLEWTAPKITSEYGAADQYQIEWAEQVSGSCSASGMTWNGPLDVGSQLNASVPDLDPTKTWCLQVKAVNTYGTGDPSATVTREPKNPTKPLPPANVAASTDQVGKVVVTWDAVTANVSGSTPSCSSGTFSGDYIRNPKETVYRVTRNTVNDPTGASGSLVTLWTGTAAGSSYTGSGPIYDAATSKFTFVDDTIANCTSPYYWIEALDRLCYLDGNTNTTGLTSLAKSGVSTVAQGTAISGGHAPVPPTNLSIDESNSSCQVTGAGTKQCTVRLAWPRVTADANGNPIKVTEYAVRVVRKKVVDGSVVDDNASSPHIVTVSADAATVSPDPNVDTFFKNMSAQDAGEDLYFEFQVAAQQCANPGPVLRSSFIPTPPRKYPCNWDTTNTVSIAVTATPYQGDGLSLDSAWTVTDPDSIAVNLAQPVSSVKATIQQISPTMGDVFVDSQENTANAVFFFPGSPTNGQMWKVDFELTDNNGCKRFITRYVFDSPTSCCLVPTFFDATLISSTSRTITVKLANICDVPIVIQTNGLRINHTATSGGNGLDTILWPGLTTATTVNNTSGSVTLSPPTGATKTIAANSSTYQLTMTFKKNISESMLTGLCSTYLASGGTSPSSCRVVTPSTTSMTDMITCP